MNKRTSFLSLEKKAQDFSGIGFLGDMDDDEEEIEPQPIEISSEGAHQTPARDGNPLHIETPSAPENSYAFKECIPKESGVGATDFVPNDDPITAGAIGEECGAKDEVLASALPGIDPVNAHEKESSIEEIDASQNNNLETPNLYAPEETGETNIEPIVDPPDTHESSSGQQVIADRSLTEESAARTLCPLEACSNPQQTSASGDELTQPSAKQLNGILLLHFQTMIQLSQVLSRGPIEMRYSPCKKPLRKNALSFQATGSYFGQDSRRNLLGFNSQIYGAAFDIQHMFSDRWEGGVTTGYSYSKLHWNKDRGKAFLHSIYFGGLFGYFGKKAYAQTHALGDRTLYRAQRGIQCQSVMKSITSKHWGWNLSVGLSGGIPIPLKRSLLIPEAEFTYLSSFGERYREHGLKNTSLSIRRNYASLLHQEVSIRFIRESLIWSMCLSPSLRAGYARDTFLKNNRYAFHLSESQGSQIKCTANGFHKSMNFFTLETLVTLSHYSCFLLSIGYEAKLGAHSQLHEGKTQLAWNF